MKRKNSKIEEREHRGIWRIGCSVLIAANLIQKTIQQSYKAAANFEYKFDSMDPSYYTDENRLRPIEDYQYTLICGWRKMTSNDNLFTFSDIGSEFYQFSYYYFEGGKKFYSIDAFMSLDSHCILPPTDPNKFKYIFFCGVFSTTNQSPPPTFLNDYFLFHSNSDISTSCTCPTTECDWKATFLTTQSGYRMGSVPESLIFKDSTIKIEQVRYNFTMHAVEAYFSTGSSDFSDFFLYNHDLLKNSYPELDFVDLEIQALDGTKSDKGLHSATVLKSDGVGLSSEEMFAMVYSTNQTSDSNIQSIRQVFTQNEESSSFGVTGVVRFFEEISSNWEIGFTIEFTETSKTEKITITKPEMEKVTLKLKTKIDGNIWVLDPDFFLIGTDEEISLNFVLRIKKLMPTDDENYQENKLVMNVVIYNEGYRISASKVIDGSFQDQNMTFKINANSATNFRVNHVTLASNPTDIEKQDPSMQYRLTGSLTENFGRVFACYSMSLDHYGVNSDLNDCEALDINSCKFGFQGQCLDCNDTLLIDKYTKQCTTDLTCADEFYLNQVDFGIKMNECSRCPHFFKICPEGIDEICPPNEQCSEIQSANYSTTEKGFYVKMSSSLTNLEDLIKNISFALAGKTEDTKDIVVSSDGHRVHNAENNEFFISTVMNDDFEEDPIDVKIKATSPDFMSDSYITDLGYVFKGSKAQAIVTTDSIYKYLIVVTFIGGFAMNLGQIFMMIVQKFQYMVTFSYIRQIFFMLCFCHLDHKISSRAVAAGLMLTYNPITLFTKAAAPTYPYECSLPKYFSSDKIYLPCSFLSTRASFWLAILGVYLIIKVIVSSISYYKRRGRRGMTRALLKGETSKSDLSSIEKINLWMHHKFVFYVIECAFTEWFLIGVYYLQAGYYDSFNLIFIFTTLLLILCNTSVVIHCTLFIFWLIKRHTPCMNKVAKFTANFAFVFNLKKLSFSTKIYPLAIKLVQLIPMTYFIFSGSDVLAEDPEYNRHHGFALVVQALGFFLVINHCKPFLKSNAYLSLISALTLLCSVLYCFNYLKNIDREYRNICNLVFSLIVLFIGLSWVWFSFTVMGDLCRAWNMKRKSQSI